MRDAVRAAFERRGYMMDDGFGGNRVSVGEKHKECGEI